MPNRQGGIQIFFEPCCCLSIVSSAIKLNKEISLKTVTEVVAVLVQLYDKMHWLNSLSLIILAVKNMQGGNHIVICLKLSMSSQE